jgi:hypothetical protein
MRSLFILCLSLSGGLAEAGGLYINGVPVDGVRNLKLSGVDVEIDAAGDVRILARGYRVEAQEVTPRPLEPRLSSATPPANTTTPAPRTARPTATPSPRPSVPRRYYIANHRRGDAQWEFDVYLNGRLVRRFSSREATAPIDVTAWMHAGDNTVHIRAVKREGERTSIGAEDYFEVVLGEGQPQPDGQVIVDGIYTYRRTGAEPGLFTNDATVTLR